MTRPLRVMNGIQLHKNLAPITPQKQGALTNPYSPQTWLFNWCV